MLDEPQDMMAAYFAGVLDADGADRLADWIMASDENARSFANFAIEHHALEHLLRVEKYGDLAVLSQSEFFSSSESDQAQDRPTDLEILSEMEENASAQPVVLEASTKRLFSGKQGTKPNTADANQPRDAYKSEIIVPRPLFWGGVAVLLLLGFWISWQLLPQTDGQPDEQSLVVKQSPVTPPPPVALATIESDTAATWDDGEIRSVGEQLFEGEYLLSEGAVRLRFKNNALVIVESPARFSLNSSSVITLEEGQLVCHCDTVARGFQVKTPYGNFVDLGTKFGVLVRPWKESQLHVFHGEVRATSSHTTDSDRADSMVVRTAQAVAIGPIHDHRIQSLVKADAELFKSAQTRLVTRINTGASLNSSEQDNQWLVTRLNNQAIDPPLPAVLFVPPTKKDLQFGPTSKLPAPIFVPNQAGELCWIKPDNSLLLQDVSTTTYTTSFDLAGYDISTAKLDMGFNADNSVGTIRLNGRSILIPDTPKDPNISPYAKLHRIEIQDGFLQGSNQIEIVVVNAKPTARPTYTGLIAELSITAQPDWVVEPKQEQHLND